MLISRNVYLFQVIKISILMKYVDFQKCIPVSGYKKLYFDEVRWFPKMYTWFKLWKFLFWWSTLISKNVYLFQVIKISILMKYVDFQKCIPDSGYKNIYVDRITLISINVNLFEVIKIPIFMKYVDSLECIPVSGYKDINFDELRWFP